jgi:glucose-6-phosphate 1-dehydrogenase
MIDKVDKRHSTKGNCLFYLAIAPRFFSVAVKQLGDAGLVKEEKGRWRRVIIEKPFGRDLDSARALNKEIKSILEEKQIYRIDHYLGKETVQNLLAFRFSNGIFEPIWNSRYIDHVQITAAETVGVEERGGYYDQSGALRDMVPNHVMQLISMVAMEPPYSFEADAVRDEKAKVLHAISPIKPEEVLQNAVRGQYGAGTEDGKPAPAYRTEPQVKPDSNTETYAALKLYVDNWRWARVPFYVRTGKRMKRRVTEVAIQFKRAPFTLFRHTAVANTMPNLLLIHVQPDEGISLGFSAKIPGPTMRLGQVDMNFKYSDYFGAAPSTGYETLILDCMIGDPTLFQRDDMVEAGWRIVTPLLDLWNALPAREFPNYPAGSWGPKDADQLLERDGRQWCFHNEK